MKKQLHTSLSIVFIVQMIFVNGLYSQGIVTGTLTGGGAKASLPFANVYVQGTTIGTATDLDGKYYLTGIPSGEQKIVYSFMGYEKQVISLTIKDGETITQHVNLLPASIMGKEVVITGQLLGQTKAINQQLNADAIVNIVSQDKIQELPDVNAAEAVSRLPGVALQRNSGEGQKIMIRGLDPKFTNITMNGVKVPSNDPTDKSVDLSMISPELLSGIEVYKSPTPDMDGDAIGGTVNLGVKKAPDKEDIIRVKLGKGYNAQHQDFKDYNASAQFYKRFFNKKFGVIAQGNIERVNRGNDIFGGKVSTENNKLFRDYAELTDRTETRKRYGASLNLDYSHKNHTIVFNTFFSQTDRKITERGAKFSPNDINNVFKTYIEDKDVSLQIFSMSARGEHIFNKLTLDWTLARSYTSNETPYRLYLEFPDDNAYDNFVPKDATFDQYINLASYNESRAYLREMQFTPDSINENVTTAMINLKYELVAKENIGIELKTGIKLNQLNRTRDPSEFGELWYYLGTNVMENAIERYNGNIALTDEGLIALSNFIDNDYDSGDFLTGNYPFSYNVNAKMSKEWYESQKDHLTENRKISADKYEISERVAAGYFMANMKLFKKLVVITGFRYEYTDNEYNAKDSTLNGLYGETGTIRDTTSTTKYGEFLPHLHLKFEPNDWMDARLSVAKTLARPDYNYIAPRTLININSNRITSGNPSLKHMVSINYDFSLSFYKSKFGLFTAGIFYKDIKDVFFPMNNIYLQNDSVAEAYGFPGRKTYYLTTYINSSDAKVYGYELDLQTNFRFLPKPFDGIVLSMNYTRLFSETSVYHFTKDTVIFEIDPITGSISQKPIYTKHERKISIPGQVARRFNISLGYDHKGFSGRISTVFQGSYLNNPGSIEVLDAYTWKFWRFDISLKQKITKFLSVYANVVNVDFGINNNDEEAYYNQEFGYPKRLQDYGGIVNAGLQLNF